MLKRFFALELFCLCAVFAYAPRVFAAEFNADEKFLVEFLSKVSVLGFSLNAGELNQVENYLMSEGVSLTKNDVAQITANIEECAQIALTNAKIYGVNSLSKLPASVKDELLRKANKAAKPFNLSVDYNAVNKRVSVVSRITGEVIFSYDAVIKQTGFSPAKRIICVSAFFCLAVFIARLKPRFRSKT